MPAERNDFSGGFPSFLQSAEWEEFQRLLGRRTWRVEGALIIGHDLPFGLRYLYCPRPESRITNHESRIKVFEKIGEIAEAEGSIFLKIDPLINFELRDIGCMFREVPSLQPRQTIVINLRKSEGEMLAEMREKTRYNIRLAGRKNVECRISNAGRPGDFEIFWGMLRETASRDGFHTHPRSYYERLIKIRSEIFSNELFFAEYRGVPVAAALVNFYPHPRKGVEVYRSPNVTAGSATYLHGASSRRYREVMASHLLHWRIIQEAKRRGFEQYDLWGVDEQRWPGLTRFKRGFGGTAVQYPPSVEIVYRPLWHRMYQLARITLGYES